jgi:2,4-dienoyl-CoA reductase-like NADH-dependent reductase (Old Yellow Enzyme family)
VKLGFIDIMEGGLGLDESIRRAKLLEAAGADAFEVSCNLMTSYADNIVPYVAVDARRALADLLPHRLWRPPAAEAYYRWIARAVRPAVQVPLVLGGGIRSVSTMGAALLEGEADLGGCGLTGHDDASSPTVSGRSEEMTDELAD